MNYFNGSLQNEQQVLQEVEYEVFDEGNENLTEIEDEE